MKVGLIYDPMFLKHETGDHVENGRRLVTTMSLLNESGLTSELTAVPARAASRQELLLVHTEQHVDRIQRVCRAGGGWLDGDTIASADSYHVALQAAGGTLAGVDAVVQGQVDHAFALVRPPGHHATSTRAMGFCLFNNVAIAAQYAIEHHNLQRILIADFDVHHGNGTEEIFYADPRVLYFSTHQYPHYPGTGASGDQGRGPGQGTTVNLPLAASSGDDVYRDAYKNKLVPVARQFRPEMILVSAGYDGHWADPLSGMRVTTHGFAEIVEVLRDLARELCGGRLLLALEGGYDLRALSFSIRASFEVLLGMPLSPDPLGEP